jgi:DNA-binding MarR family transcriptional regulator
MTRTVLTQDPRTAELAAQMRPLVHGLYDLVRRHSPKLGTTTLTQNSVLSVLVTDGPQRMSVLAEREGVRLPTMTNVVGRLERAGYVTRASDPDDRRVVMVSATPQARRDVARVRKAREVFLQERLARLSAKDQELISRAVPALERLLDQ